jgi:hypothetical protein
MARKKREGRGGAHGGAAGRDADRLSEYGDDAASMVSESTSAACSTLSGFTKQEEDGYYGGGGAASAVDSELLDALDQLTEKRGSTRVTGLESLLKYLQVGKDVASTLPAAVCYPSVHSLRLAWPLSIRRTRIPLWNAR